MDTKIQNTKRELTPEEKSERNTLIYSLLVTLLLCLLGGGNTTIAIVAFFAYVPLALHPEFLIGPMLFTTVFDDYILIAEGQSLGRYIALLFIVSVLAKLMFSHTNIKLDFWFIISIVLILSSTTLSLFGLMGHTSLPISFIFNILLFLAFINCPTKKSNKLLTVQIWCYSIVSTIYATWFLLQNGLSVFEEGRIGQFEESVNANDLAVGLALLAAVVVSHFLANNFKNKTLHLVFFVGSVIITVLTGSRTSLIAILVSTIFVFLYWMKINSKITFKVLFIIIGILLMLIISYNILLKNFPVLMERFTIESVIDSGGTGRFNVWKTYMNVYFPDYWLLGIGFDPQNIFKAVEVVNGVGHGAHNIIIDILASSGIFGLFIYILIFSHSYKEINSCVKSNAHFLIPISMIVCVIFTGVGENVIRGRLLWFSIALGILMVKLHKNSSQKDETEKKDN